MDKGLKGYKNGTEWDIGSLGLIDTMKLSGKERKPDSTG